MPINPRTWQVRGVNRVYYLDYLICRLGLKGIDFNTANPLSYAVKLWDRR